MIPLFLFKCIFLKNKNKKHLISYFEECDYWQLEHKLNEIVTSNEKVQPISKEVLFQVIRRKTRLPLEYSILENQVFEWKELT